MSISVIIPCRHQNEYLRRCLASVEWQLNPEDQVLVVEDNGDVARGVSATRNIGVESTHGEWVKFLDADDVLAPFALNVVRENIEPQVKVILGQQFIVKNGKLNCQFIPIQKVKLTRIANVFFVDPVSAIKHVNPGLVSNSFVRRDVLNEIGGFNEGIDFEEDWDFWLRVHRKYGDSAFAYTHTPICFYWIDDKERSEKVRRNTVDYKGETINVREYFKLEYGCQPQ